MSFIDLMSNNIFTEADILNRTQAMVRTFYSDEQEKILSRKVTGMMLGGYSLSIPEQEEIANFSTIVNQAKIENELATIDNELLKQIIEVEKSYLKLQVPIPEEIIEEGIIINQVEIDIFLEEKRITLEIVSEATEEIMTWVLKRNLEPEIN